MGIEKSTNGFERADMERVRQLGPDDFRCLREDAGLEIEREPGDYACGPLGGERARAIFSAHGP